MVKILAEKTETTTKKVVVAIQCDRCQKVYRKEEVEGHILKKFNDMWEINEFLRLDFSCGYGSIFGDGAKVECDLCQHCVKDLIGPYARIQEHSGAQWRAMMGTDNDGNSDEENGTGGDEPDDDTGVQ